MIDWKPQDWGIFKDMMGNKYDWRIRPILEETRKYLLSELMKKSTTLEHSCKSGLTAPQVADPNISIKPPLYLLNLNDLP